MTVSSRVLVDCDLRRPQMAEQLVEVPTVLSYALLQQSTAEQIIDIPVPGCRRGQGGIYKVHDPGQSSTTFSGAQHEAQFSRFTPRTRVQRRFLELGAKFRFSSS